MGRSERLKAKKHVPKSEKDKQAETDKVIATTQKPPFLHLFSPDQHEKVKRKLAAFAMRFTHTVWLTFNATTRMHFVVTGRLGSEFPPIPRDPAAVISSDDLFAFFPAIELRPRFLELEKQVLKQQTELAAARLELQRAKATPRDRKCNLNHLTLRYCEEIVIASREVL